MARTTSARGRKAVAKHGSADLLDRLKFVQQVQKKDGSASYESHCYIRNGRISAFDGTFAVGMPLAEDFTACPNTYDFVAALERCDETASIVANDDRITINSGKSTFRIKCLKATEFPEEVVDPDRQIASLNNTLRTGIEVVARLAKEGDIRLPMATVLLEANTVSATNGYGLLQFWHGIDLPPNLIIPRKFCDMVVRHKADLVGFGWTENVSVTFWFSDGSFIKTLLPRSGGWPNLDHLFQYPATLQPLPEGFADGVGKMASMTKNGFVEFAGGEIRTYGNDGSSAHYECNVPDGRIFNGKTLSQLIPLMDSIDMSTHSDRMFFTGYNGAMRGTLMIVRGNRNDVV